jgi:hypothetical protein
MISDTQEQGLTFTSYGDASILVSLYLEPPNPFQYYILTPLTPITEVNQILATYEVFKLYCSSFDWNFNLKSSQGHCTQYSSTKDLNFFSPTLLCYDTATQRIVLNQSLATRDGSSGFYLVHIELSLI